MPLNFSKEITPSRPPDTLLTVAVVSSIKTTQQSLNAAATVVSPSSVRDSLSDSSSADEPLSSVAVVSTTTASVCFAVDAVDVFVIFKVVADALFVLV